MGFSRPFLRLGICVSSLGVSWCFLHLEIFIFLFGFLRMCRIFNVRVWSVSCVIGLGSLVGAFYFFSCPTDPSLSVGPGVIPFARLFAFLPSRRPPHSLRGHGLGNRADKTEARDCRFSCSFFFCRPADALLSSQPGGGQGNLATHTTSQDCMFCLSFAMHVVLFSLLICVFG